MAWRKLKGRKNVKRRARRPARRAKKQTTTLINKSVQPLPSRYMCRMKYATNVTTGALNGAYSMNLNSLFDPDRTGTGHQPLGFDNLSLLYNKYRVVSASYRINRCASASDPAIQIGCIPSNDPGATTVFTNFSLLKESPRAKYVIQNPGAPSVPLKGKVYMPKMLGRTYTQYMADDITGSEVNASPVEEIILYIQTATAADFVQGSVALSIVLTFDVEFYDLKHLDQS